MLMITSRAQRWSCTELSSQDEVLDCVLENPDPSVDQLLKPEAFLERIRGKRVLLLVHGYNNDEDDVCRAYGLIAQRVGAELAGAYDVVVGYTWPGGDLRVSYPAARHRAKACAPRLAARLGRVAAVASAVDLLCHSLGNFLALRALATMASGKARFRFAWMTAAAVHDEALEPGEPFAAVPALFQGFCIYHSRRDRVLRLAFPLAEGDRALGLCGPENPEAVLHLPTVQVVNCKRVVGDHGAYKRCPELYAHLRSRLQGVGGPQFVTL